MRNVEDTARLGWKGESQHRRQRNREQSATLLRANNIEFESKNGGAHLIIVLPNRLLDFWPGTGLWVDRKTKHSGRGVFNLVKRCKRVMSLPETVIKPQQPPELQQHPEGFAGTPLADPTEPTSPLPSD